MLQVISAVGDQIIGDLVMVTKGAAIVNHYYLMQYKVHFQTIQVYYQYKRLILIASCLLSVRWPLRPKHQLQTSPFKEQLKGYHYKWLIKCSFSNLFSLINKNRLLILLLLRVVIIKMNKQQQDNVYVPSKYSLAFKTYSRTQIRTIIPILRTVAKSCHIGFRFPIFKILKAIAKIFLINEIEAIFFVYMIKETNWDINDRLITQNSQHIRDIISISSDHPQYKNLILYLMLITYTLKFFLNQQHQDLLDQAVKICPGFRCIFENWAKKHSSLTKRINPKTLNKVYQDIILKVRHEQPDFNLLVDSTLQISPAYNPEKTQKNKNLEKKQGRPAENELMAREQPSKMIKTEALDRAHFEQNPLFSSSRINQMITVGLNINGSDASNFQVFGLINKSLNIGTRFGNSVFGSSALIGVPSCPPKDQQYYCEQLNLGLQQGQSEQNINLQEEGPPPTSVINLSRVNLITERYLTLQREESQNYG